MNGNDMIEAMGYVAEDLILNTETIKKSNKRTFRRKIPLIAAVAAILLCGTAAAAGLLWNPPDVRLSSDGVTVYLNQSIAVLPEEAERTILDSADPERDHKAFLCFDSVKEWQAFFGLPFVSSPLLMPDETPMMTEKGAGLIQKGAIEVIVTTEEGNGKRVPAVMLTDIRVDRFDESSGVMWSGMMELFAAYTEEASKSASSGMLWEDCPEQVLTEYTTPSGVSCVIFEIHTGGQVIDCGLYYSFESVLYQLTVKAHSGEEAERILRDLRDIADHLQIVSPSGS
ncbi:MAG: hypothetical protein K6A33_12635 [Clostridiales bacterium]|nr:hypothetical protein [Clostridiales bacterium]